MTDRSTWTLDVVSCPKSIVSTGQEEDGGWEVQRSEVGESLAPSAKGLQALEDFP